LADAPDLTAAHRALSAHCFNATWDLIEKADRTPQDEERMVQLAVASLYHWTQRPDFGPKEASVGHWQVSRVYALIGEASLARRHGQRSLDSLQGTPVGPFYVGYAHEALARAASVAGDRDATQRHLAHAREAAGEVSDAKSRQWLQADLETIAVP
jgi:hypothetical protein